MSQGTPKKKKKHPADVYSKREKKGRKRRFERSATGVFAGGALGAYELRGKGGPTTGEREVRSFAQILYKKKERSRGGNWTNILQVILEAIEGKGHTQKKKRKCKQLIDLEVTVGGKKEGRTRI